MAPMCWWLRAARILASRSKRARRSVSLTKSGGRILIATSRSSWRSRARYTRPIPPLPRRPTIVYAPNSRPMKAAASSAAPINAAAGPLSPSRLGRLERKPSASLCAASSDRTSSRRCRSSPQALATYAARSASGSATAASNTANARSRFSRAILRACARGVTSCSGATRPSRAP